MLHRKLIVISLLWLVVEKIVAGQLIYYKLLKLSKICDKTGSLKLFSLSRAWKFLVNIWFFEQIF